MNNHQVAKAFATQSKFQAKGSNFFFEGSTIYSYGYHFPVATLVTDAHGRTTALLTSAGYSRTTARHISIVQMALHFANVPTFHVPSLKRNGVSATYDLADAREAYLENARAAFRAAARARTYKFHHLERAAELEAKALALTEAFAVTV